jgi:hypothetical protein
LCPDCFEEHHSGNKLAEEIARLRAVDLAFNDLQNRLIEDDAHDVMREFINHFLVRVVNAERELRAHIENEGDECPLCAAERSIEILRTMNDLMRRDLGIEENSDKLIDYYVKAQEIVFDLDTLDTSH